MQFAELLCLYSYPLEHVARMTAQSPEIPAVVRALNSLLRTEISATETYSQVIPRLSGGLAMDVGILRTIAQTHSQAVQRLRAEIQQAGGTPDETSGSWPAITKTLAGPAKVFGDAAALNALKESEARGLEDYREALRQLYGPTCLLISEDLIPARVKHVEQLESMLAKL